jgi:3-isopropylmalate/(R)-2-methylmalate dehydratase large subunit
MSTETAIPRTLFEKIWSRHVVADLGEGFTLLHVDRHVVPDFNGNAFAQLRARGLKVRNPELNFASPDHSVSSDPRGADPTQSANPHVIALRADTREFGVRLFDVGQPGHGIVHVITPELGIALPGLTVAIGDSHTCTNGALGALAWGVGQGELVHILATQTCVQHKPRTMRVTLDGELPPGTSGKDLILHLIGTLGVAAGNGHAVEYAGSAVRALPMEGRFTLCNMSIEWGARYGMVAPDERTFGYLAGRRHAPSDADWDAAVEDWKTLASDPGAHFDREVRLDVSALAPQVTWGNGLDMVVPIGSRVPDPATEPDSARRSGMEASLRYMDLVPGQALEGLPIDRVFIGSCTNSRLSDLRAAADVVRGRKVSPRVQAWVVPGSEQVRRDAEDEGLHRVFTEAGFDWRSPGCSMCLGGNGDTIGNGERAVSTANRNFAGRQGPGSRTHIASPALAAASACAGAIADPRKLEGHAP